jgi:hypothetical protein
MAVSIINSTISGNASAATAGAMLAFGNVTLQLDNTTVNGQLGGWPAPAGCHERGATSRVRQQYDTADVEARLVHPGQQQQHWRRRRVQ